MTGGAQPKASRARLVVALALALLAMLAARAEASTWTVSLQATVDGAPLQAGFQVTLADPSGAATVSVGGLPVVASHTVDTFTVRLNDTRTVGTCSIVFIVEGVLTPPTGSGVTSAPGALTGVRRSTCQVTPYSIPPPPGPGPPPPGQVITTLPIGGSFTVLRVDGSDASSVGAVTGTVIARTPRTSRAVGAGTALLPESLIQTGSNGSLVLGFQDGSQLNVGANTLVTILPDADGDISLNQIAGVLVGSPGTELEFAL